ncbi:MAG TPA: tetratricopeptide repeat protein, partial [Kofleriaceae bacterium]|nr:tetratricopeptide repeat protein [Kofleriaceae bacterium]
PLSPPPRAGTPPQRPGTPPRGDLTPGRPADATPTEPNRAPTAPAQPAQRTAPVFDERIALQDALNLLGTRNWSGARVALHALAARVPQSKHYRALLCYTRGREAQSVGRFEDALLEYQRALQLDPELAHAKQALAEIRRR